MHHDLDPSLSSCGAFILHKILFSENSNMCVHMSREDRDEDRDEQKLELKGSHSSASPSSVSPILIQYAT